MFVIFAGPNFQLSQHLDALSVVWEASRDQMHLQCLFLHHLVEVQTWVILLLYSIDNLGNLDHNVLLFFRLKDATATAYPFGRILGRLLKRAKKVAGKMRI